MRKFGVTFLFINLYTKYFEFFWGVAHKAIFFTILALSFWVVRKCIRKKNMGTLLRQKFLMMMDKACFIKAIG